MKLQRFTLRDSSQFGIAAQGACAQHRVASGVGQNAAAVVILAAVPHLLNVSGSADRIFLLSTFAMAAMGIGTALVVKMSKWR
ncbi:hypothetical protein CAP39_07900 [Sphingomonas sp. IBVSS1]|nr:hypothetical protein CAP39_07900 [Sphingomonas sp. IBVSS1]